MRIAYIPSKALRESTRLVIAQANTICAEYAAQGLDLTLRQVYYQFVTRDLFPEDRRWIKVEGRYVRSPEGSKNESPNYKWLGPIIADARLLGLLDWDYIVDRTRIPHILSHWDDPAHLITSAAEQYREDLWADQDNRVEVWVEKDALLGVIQRTTERERVLSFSCRGNASHSSIRQAALRHLTLEEEGRQVIVLYLGDHDPSGLDMIRDIAERLAMFGSSARVIHIALTVDQIEELQIPPDPAKLSDARAAKYVAKYGLESWELDALDPAYLDSLIKGQIAVRRNAEAWQEALDAESANRDALMETAESWTA